MECAHAFPVSFAVLIFFLFKSYLDFQFHPLLDLFSFLVHGNGKQPQPVINISYLPDFVFFVFHLLENLFPFLRPEKQLQPVCNISYPFQIYLSNSLHFKSSKHQCYNVLIKTLQIFTRGTRLFRYKKLLVLRRISCHGRNYSQPYFFKRNQSSDNRSHGFGAKFLLKKLSASDFSYERKSAFTPSIQMISS